MAINGTSILKLKKEIEKCDVLCANYHREHNYLERNGQVSQLVSELS